MLTERGAPPAGGGRIRHCLVVSRSWFPLGHQSSVGGLQASMKHEINVLTSVYTLTVLPDVGSL